MADKPAQPASGLEDTAIAATQSSSLGAVDGREPAPGNPERATRMRLVHAGDALGRYTLDEEVGEGGMATVFRARDTELRREVAIKVLFPHLARRDEVVRRFQREARAAAGLEHPNILRVYDVGGAAGGDPPFIVMELIRGRSLLAEIEQRGPILTELVACVGALLADALGAAHAAGIVHRDVKPANVLIAPGGRLLLADFGVARLETEDSLVTKTGSVLGTPAYMSPEQAAGEVSTRQSDLYSLGVTLYQLATGSLPYSGSPARVLAAIVAGGFAPAVRRRAAVGGDLSRVIDRLMAVETSARPADAATVAAELRAIAAAGGLGEATDELAAHFADPAVYATARTPVVVAALIAAAEDALAAGKLPRAMALADRAAALAPADPAVTAVVTRVTEGGRASSRRRTLVLAAAGLVVAGGAAAGSYAVLGERGAAVLALDAVAVGAAPADAAAAVRETAVPPTDAAALSAVTPVTPVTPLDASVRPRADAAPRPARDARSPDVAAPIAVDAAAAAAPDASAALPAEGKIMVTLDTWCDLSLDGASVGRLAAPFKKLIEHVAVGRHVVRCAQGDPTHAWTQEVDVPAGGTAAAIGRLLATLVVTIKTRQDVQIDGVTAARGTIVRLAHGNHRFVEGTSGAIQRLDLATDCTLVDQDNDSGAPLLACASR